MVERERLRIFEKELLDIGVDARELSP